MKLMQRLTCQVKLSCFLHWQQDVVNDVHVALVGCTVCQREACKEETDRVR